MQAFLHTSIVSPFSCTHSVMITYITQVVSTQAGTYEHKLVAVTSSPAVSVSTCEYLCRRSSLFSSKYVRPVLGLRSEGPHDRHLHHHTLLKVCTVQHTQSAKWVGPKVGIAVATPPPHLTMLKRWGLFSF